MDCAARLRWRRRCFANDLVSIDRNDGVWADRHLPRGELWRARRARQIFAGTSIQRINGAATWYDAICLNTERLQIALLAATVAAGAEIANYTRALEIRRDSVGTSGVHVRDEPPAASTCCAPGRSSTPPARGSTNGWRRAGSTPGPRHYAASKAFNLLTRPLPFVESIALPCSSTYFAIPWNGRTLIGTRHLRCPHVVDGRERHGRRSARIPRRHQHRARQAPDRGVRRARRFLRAAARSRKATPATTWRSSRPPA